MALIAAVRARLGGGQWRSHFVAAFRRPDLNLRGLLSTKIESALLNYILLSTIGTTILLLSSSLLVACNTH